MTNEWVDDNVAVAMAVAQPTTSKLYINNLHADTNVEDLVAILEPMTTVQLHNPFVSNLRRGRRWAKVDIEAFAAQDLIDRFNMVAGVMHGQSRCEFARS